VIHFARILEVFKRVRNARTWLSALLFDLGNTPLRFAPDILNFEPAGFSLIVLA
jgi:hypothetical protein